MKSLSFDPKKIISALIWWSGVIGLFLLAHTRIEFLLNLFQQTWLSGIFHTPQQNALAVASVITPVRGLLLVYSLTVLAYPILSGILRSGIERVVWFDKKILVQTVVLLIVLGIIFPPGGIGGLAQEYANSSLVMFSRVPTVSYHQRILLPALAHILFFRGDLFYLAFSFICTALLILTLRVWFENNHVQVSAWQFISLGTLSFVYSSIQLPGYPDVLVHLFILLAFTFRFDARANLSLFALSLAAHEGSLVIWFALAFQLFDRRGFVSFLGIGVLYAGLFIYANDGLAGLLSSRELGGSSNLMWVMNYPFRELLGVFFGLKALWGVVIAAIVYLALHSLYPDAVRIIMILFAGVVMTFLGVDTSRLFGWTFMAVLICWKILEQAGGIWRKILTTTLIINLVIPSVNVLLIVEPSLANGIYRWIFGFLFPV